MPTSLALKLCWLTLQAKKVLVESYKQLRTGDAAPGSRSAYRITVRQLEALVRLSEAHARVRCDEWIQPRDVREVTPAKLDTQAALRAANPLQVAACL